MLKSAISGKTVVERHAGARVSAFDAKTHFAELLRQAELGRSFLICRRGKPVAQLVPPPIEDGDARLRNVIEGLSEIRNRIERKGGKLHVKQLIEEGRI